MDVKERDNRIYPWLLNSWKVWVNQNFLSKFINSDLKAKVNIFPGDFLNRAGQDPELRGTEPG